MELVEKNLTWTETFTLVDKASEADILYIAEDFMVRSLLSILCNEETPHVVILDLN